MSDLLTPNQQLLLWLSFFIFASLLVGVAFAVLRRQLNAMQEAQGGAVIPLFRASLEAVQAILTHPHAFAAEMDALMVADLADLTVPMSPRLKHLLVERSLSEDPNLREDEVEAALAYPWLRRLAAKEAGISHLLTEIQTTIKQAPEGQAAEDAKKDAD